MTGDRRAAVAVDRVIHRLGLGARQHTGFGVDRCDWCRELVPSAYAFTRFTDNGDGTHSAFCSDTCREAYLVAESAR